MSSDQRVYSDEEFSLILRKATELASRADGAMALRDGLTLDEMKAAAAQAGIDPAILERAARMVAVTSAASPLDRLIGGPDRHHLELHFPVKLDQEKAALLLSAVRIRSSLPGSTSSGHSSSLGMTWHDGGDMEALGITARPEEDGTAVSVVLDRRGTLVLVGAFSGVALFLSVLFSIFALYPEAPALGMGGLVASVGGTFAIARSFWASSTRRVRERISAVMDAISETLNKDDS